MIGSAKGLLCIVIHFIVRPRLWRPGLTVAYRFRTSARYFWLPSHKFIRFRLETMYGEVRVPPVNDVENFVLWAYRFPR